MRINEQFIHIVEIQHRPRSVENGGGEKRWAEEPYTGFVFKADNPQQVDEVIKYFMSRIRYVKGIVKHLLRRYPISNGYCLPTQKCRI